MSTYDVEGLFRAAATDDAAYIQQAAREGANLNVSWHHGNFLLRNACQTASLNALRALLELGAEPNRRFTYVSPVDKRCEADVVALMYADVEAARLLVQYGADVNVQDAGGTTALMRAAFFGRASLVEFLLASGADPHAKQHPRRGRKALTSLGLARDKLNMWESIPVQERKQPAYDELRNGCAKTVDLLVRAGAA